MGYSKEYIDLLNLNHRADFSDLEVMNSLEDSTIDTTKHCQGFNYFGIGRLLNRPVYKYHYQANNSEMDEVDTREKFLFIDTTVIKNNHLLSFEDAYEQSVLVNNELEYSIVME